MIAQYHLVHNLLFSHLLSKNLRIKVYGTMIYSVLGQHQYIIINTLVLATTVFINYLQSSVYYMEVHSVCTYITGSHSVYIKS